MNWTKNVGAALVAVGMLLGGCSSVSEIAGEWGKNSPDKDNVSAVKEGMDSTDVILKIGKPHEVSEGENLYAGWQEWTYPTGSLVVYRGKVQSVLAKQLTKEQLATLKDPKNKYDLNLKKLEGDYKKEEDSAGKVEGANGIWAVDSMNETAPIAPGNSKGIVGKAENPDEK